MRAIIVMLCLAGCAGTPSPYVDAKMVIPHNRGSDWVLQPEREWVCKGKASCETEARIDMAAGLEWDNRVTLSLNWILIGPWQQVGLSFAKEWDFAIGGSGWGVIVQPALYHQFDGPTSWFLRTDQLQWQSHNPFLHLRVGMEAEGFRCPVIATGESTYSFARGKWIPGEHGPPDLYWTQLECGARFWGKTGAFQ